MPLKIEIYLPAESVDYITDTDDLQVFITQVGDLLANKYGNEVPEDDFKLEELSSFIIIKDEVIPNAENFENEDMFLVIPIEGE